MAVIDPLIQNPVSDQEKPSSTEGSSKIESQGSPSKENKDAFFAAFLAIVDSVNLQQSMAVTQRKAMELNISVQNKLIEQDRNVELNTWGEEVKAMIQKSIAALEAERKNGKISKNGGLEGPGYNSLMKLENKKEKRLLASPPASALQELGIQNQKAEANRGIIQQEITSSRQGLQLDQSNMSTNIDQGEQTAQQGVKLLNIIVNVSQSISSI